MIIILFLVGRLRFKLKTLPPFARRMINLIIILLLVGWLRFKVKTFPFVCERGMTNLIITLLFVGWLRFKTKKILSSFGVGKCI